MFEEESKEQDGDLILSVRQFLLGFAESAIPEKKEGLFRRVRRSVDGTLLRRRSRQASASSWQSSPNSVIGLLTEYSSCVNAVLLEDTARSTPIIDGLLRNYLHDIETDMKQQRLLRLILENLLTHHFETAPLEDMLRGSNTPLTLLLSKLSSRPESTDAVTSLLANALDNSKNPTEDPFILAERILNRLEVEAMPFCLRIPCELILCMSPPNHRERFVGGFFFLRCLNPKLVSFQSQKHDQKILINVARYLQRLANSMDASTAMDNKFDDDDTEEQRARSWVLENNSTMTRALQNLIM